MRRTLFTAGSAIACAVAASGAMAGSVLQPGGTVGLPAGAPLPEGVYFIDTSSYGQRTDTPTGLGINLTQVVWATPYKFYDTRLQFVVLQPTAYTTDIASSSITRFYANSTLLAAQAAHDFGSGFGASYQAGYRAAMPDKSAFREDSFEHRLALSYTGNGFDLTVNVINGVFGGSTVYPDWLNIDVTATRKFGKFEIGGVAFGSSDLDRPNAAYKRQRQIAAGGLVGYNFGPFVLQAYVTRDITQRNYTGYDTRGFVRLIVPLWKPAPPPPPTVVARY